MKNVLDAFPEVVNEFEKFLRQRLEQIAIRSENVHVPDIVEGKEVEDRLRALGYLE